MTDIDYKLNSSSAQQVMKHLQRCDNNFMPPLSSRVDLTEYSEKLHTKAKRFEAFEQQRLIGLIALYVNPTGVGFITNVSVEPEFTGKRIASRLLQQCIEYASQHGLDQITLEVNADNKTAVRLYQQAGFLSVPETQQAGEPTLTMKLILEQHQ